MHTPRFLFSLIVLIAVLLSACGSSISTPDVMQAATPDAMMMDGTPTADAMMVDATSKPMMASPAWFGVTLTNVRNGDTFTINDFKGKVVLVEIIATSCSDCKSQQNEIKALREQLGMQDDFVSVSLDIDSNENPETLKSYVDSTDFDWSYAVASEEISHDIASLYGAEFLEPSSTTILIIDRHGVVHALPFGLKKVDDLLQVVNMYLNEGM